MIDILLDTVAQAPPIENLDWLGNLSYVALALLVAVEGPIVTLFGGLAAAAGYMRWEFVFLAAAFGNFLADMGWYGLGYLGGFDTLMRRFPRLRRYEPQIGVLQHEMHNHALKLLLVSKFTMGVAIIPTLIAAGMARVSWRRLIPVSLAAETIWTGVLVVAGYYLGDYITQLEQGLQYLALVGVIVFGLFAIWLYRRVTSNFFREEPDTGQHVSASAD